jgi:6-phosphogluconolactonase (cycloisomerase 2 family)
LYSYRFDLETGDAVLLDSVAAENPSFAIYRSGVVYAVNELNGPEAAVASYKFDRKTGSFRMKSSLPACGAAPCHLSTNGRYLFCSNYTGGNLAVFQLRGNGTIKSVKGGPVAVASGGIGGPDISRQQTPHIHCSVISPDGKYVFASDFSADRILRFNVTSSGIDLTSDESEDLTAFPLDADYGPRHLVFSPNGKYFYVVGELSGSVTAFRYNKGELTSIGVVDADPYDGRGSADIHLSPDGKFLYVSNRLVNDGISVFSVRKDGSLEFVANQATRIHPRNFNITPDGHYLLCACRDSDMIQVFLRNARTGLLIDTGRNISVRHPVCIEWAE